MQRHWDLEDVLAHFTRTDEERALVQTTRADHTCLGFAVLRKFLLYAGHFPQHRHAVPLAVVEHLAAQLHLLASSYLPYDWQGRASHYHRAQIRAALGFREATVQDADDLTT
ncbi:DUF4158 domain-containing protein [bacterium]|nr:DUF4158 domain-containing protein [bacterium]